MKNLLLFLVPIFLSACSIQKSTQDELPRPPLDDSISFTPPVNIILLLGDGLGLAQITAGMYRSANPLHLEQFQYIGLHIPYSYDNLVGDSGANSTAIACGVRTFTGAIGVDANKSPKHSILKKAQGMGMLTALVATTAITDATAAAFYANQPDLAMREAIADDLACSEIHFFAGGGKSYFINRADGRNLIQELRQKNYTITELNGVELSPNLDSLKLAKVGIFTPEDGNALESERAGEYLPNATELAIKELQRAAGDKGFFLVVADSRIGRAASEKNADALVAQVIEFDKVVGVAANFANENGETLVIVTSTQETGGFSIKLGSSNTEIKPGFTTDYHTASLVPVFAKGPGQELFAGVYENIALYQKMRILMNARNLKAN